MVQRCIDPIQDWKKGKTPMMVPSVAVAEYLIGVALSDQQRQREIIGRDFYIAPFDASAAIAAELFEKLEVKQLKDSTCIGRQCLKVDYKVATAIAHYALGLYTDDDHLRVIG